MYNFLERLKSGIYEVVKSRIFVVIIVFCILSAILLQRVFYLQIVKGQDFLDQYQILIQKTKTLQGTRGNIYDRNGYLLAYNDLAYSVTIEDNGAYDNMKLSEKNKELNKVIASAIEMVEKNGDTVINDFGIILDRDNIYQFVAQNETQRLRFIADVYGKKTIDQLTDKQKAQTAEEIIHYLCTDEIIGYSINEKKLDKVGVLKLVNVRYAMSLNNFQKYITTAISEDVSEKTVAEVMENLDSLTGVDIEETSLRRYNDGECFANMIGYTGQISQEEYDSLSKKEKENYSLTDTVGKSGLEQVLDKELQGKRGEVKIYVNSVGKVIETNKITDPKAGNDVYLNIDAKIQKAAYNILEQELAGILLSKIQNQLDYDRNVVSDGSDVIIPIGDVYNAFISNNIVDMSHFGAVDAKTAEQEVNAVFTARKAEVLQELSTIFSNTQEAVYHDMSKEQQAYLNYIISDLLTTNTGVLVSDSIDRNDATYKAWTKEESINVYTYLNYAISQNWIDTSKIKDYVASGQYSDSAEVYQGLVAYILDALQKNNSFDKLVYRYMIKTGDVSGRHISMILYEQNVLPFDEGQYNALNDGSIAAPDFITGQIGTLAITPGQLGLEPSTGSYIMTDTNSGQVLACVSYPGFDNNRLANTMDSNYYNKLVVDQARPFYNNATQEKTAPGSTYKPVSTAAAIGEGMVDLSTYIPCDGVFRKVEPNPECWIYAQTRGGHGGLDAVGAIEHSCNVFFYEAAYRMSLTEGGANLMDADNEEGTATESYYSSKLGLDKLRVYAEAFGLGSTSGLEIPESEPQISDDSSVPSAIGQGTNNFTTSQLARYVTAVANKGTVYDLSLLNKVTDIDGNTVKEYQPNIKNQITNVSAPTWDAIHQGMRAVILLDSATFGELNTSDIQVSGKTGTAQQSQTHPDHALFVGYAPSENPEIAFSTRIANGYSSVFAAEVGREVLKYYYQMRPEEEIITGTASTIRAGIRSGGD